MAKQLEHVLYVYMNGIQVGVLQQLPNDLSFVYQDDWLHNKNARPISLSMPLREETYIGDVVYNYFDNLLPDSVLIRKRIQARFQIKTNECFDVLSYIGSDCVGALQFLKEQKDFNQLKIKAKKIDNVAIADLLKNYQSAPLGMGALSNFRISIAGAQEKTALLWYQDQWYVPEENTPTSHIIKLPIGMIKHSNIDLSDSVENEWLCLKILSAYDLPVNEASIEYFEKTKALVVERFDRVWDKDKKWLLRLPQEDFCQVLGMPSSLKYESDGGPGIIQIMKILEGSKAVKTDRYQFMKTVFLFWILGAIDGHAKNFSILIEAGGRYKLTPIYDVISAYPLAIKRQLEWKELKMAMSLKSKNTHYHWHNMTLEHWLTMADKCQFPKEEMYNIINEVCDKMEFVIKTVSELLPAMFPFDISQAIFDGMRKCKSKIKH
ncbi:type II toxin-antitoxin system HipA family toxin [Candidatus Berkiella cookevillensis]|uniref:Serine/threonine-protein kinase HipA n=1 Tax=Candidatus Berkiella cookevillensis TaxID=437022 RepID=A0A0Q9YIQ0_9GAMM|nr:type II toxin-antitoxin system HipA family toxin [Candidatus Berkiella cookevillensis]MCS5708750.1 type II toxin-antitoxin system HipA family toxin [Candidatus Berkiella cookevillensis]